MLHGSGVFFAGRADVGAAHIEQVACADVLRTSHAPDRRKLIVFQTESIVVRDDPVIDVPMNDFTEKMIGEARRLPDHDRL